MYCTCPYSRNNYVNFELIAIKLDLEGLLAHEKKIVN